MTLRYACARIITKDDLSSCDCSFDKISPELTDGSVDPDDDQIGELLDAACDALANISGLPVGRCTTVYRPCRGYCHWDGCPCGCAPSGIPLPGLLPTVTEVKVDGVVVSSDTYAVITTPGGFKSLERFLATGAPDSWPSVQLVAPPDTLAGTFSIAVESGLHPDPIMKLAAAEIACDMLTALANLRATDDGAQTATVYGLTTSFARFGNPTDQETMHLAGLGQVRRHVAATGSIRYGAFTSNDMLRGWVLYTRE